MKKSIINHCVGLGCFMLIVFGAGNIHAQLNEIILNSPDSGNKTYVANQRIEFLPGYSFTASAVNKMVAYIDAGIIVPNYYTDLFTASGFDNRELNSSFAVGATSGAPSVTETGAFTYSIPIQIPAGTNGMIPQIAVGYNSQAGNGLLGMGWNLQGLSMISRTNKNLYYDNEVRAVQCDNDDVFALDGGRLMGISGTYGTDGAVYATESEDFSRVFSRGTQGNGPEWFEVKTKEGFTIEYGRTSDSRLDNNGTVLFWMINRIKDTHGNYVDYVYENYYDELRIKEIRYTGNANFGMQPYNRIQFNYKERADPFDYYMAHRKIKNASILDNIVVLAEGQQFKKYEFKYGCKLYSFLNEVIEYGTGEERFNSSVFRYENHGEGSNNHYPVQTSFGGIKNDAVLIPSDFDGDGISDLMWIETVYCPNTPIPYRIFKNQPVESNPVFESVHNGYIAPGAVFAQASNNSGGFFSNLFGGSGVSGKFTNLSECSGEVIDQTLQIRAGVGIFDFNGDHKSDISYFTLIPNGNPTSLAQHTLDNFIYLRSADLPVGEIGFNAVQSFNNLGQTNKIRKQDQFSFVGDFNGDGLNDIMYVTQNDQSTEFRAGIINGGPHPIISFGGTNDRVIDFDGGFAENLAKASRVEVLDFDGDGKSEILIIRIGTAYIYSFGDYLPNQSNTYHERVAKLIYTSGFPTMWHDFELGDINGDGKTDLVSISSDGLNYTVHYSTGLWFEDQIFVFKSNTFDSFKDRLVLTDFNGDGKTDILHVVPIQYNGSITPNSINIDENNVQVRLNLYSSNGRNFDFTSNLFPINHSNYGEPFSNFWHDFSYFQQPIIFGDFTGNSVTGAMLQYSTASFDSGNIVYEDWNNLAYFTPNSANLVMAEVSDGMNNNIAVDYKSISAESVIGFEGFPSNPSITPQYPVGTISSTIRTVNKMVTPTPEGNTTSTQFAYFGGKLHKRGKGFLGFSKVEQTDELNGVRTSSEYEFNPTYLQPFLSKMTTTLVSNDELIAEANYSHVYTARPNNRFIHYINSEQSFDYVHGREVETSYDFNLNTGNLNSTTTVNSNTETTVETYLYGTFGNELNIPNKVTQSQITVTKQGEEPFSKMSTFEYNLQRGDLLKVIDFAGTPESVTKEMEYNAEGNITKETISAPGMQPRIKSYTYDVRRRYPITHTNELDQVATMVYHPILGKPVKVTDIHGLVTETTIDEFGRDIQMTDPLGNTYLTTYTWENTSPSATQGNPLQADDVMWKIVKSGSGVPTSTTYMNRLGMKRMAKVEGMNEDVFAVTTFNNKGQVVAETAPFFSGQSDVLITEYTYDELNRVTKAENQAGTTTIAYEATNGILKITTTSPDGTIQISEEDPTGMLIKSTDNGGDLVYTYFSHGGVKQITLNNEVVATSEYDEYGRQTKLIDANAGESTYEYNAFGEMIAQTNANNETTTMVYDPVGRLEERIIPNRTLTMEYYTQGNGLNQVKKIILPESTEEMVYDNFQRPVELKKMVDGQEFVFQYAYDQLGNLDKLTYPTGYFVNHVYDSKGYLLRITDPDAHTLWEADEQDAFGRIVKFTKGDGIQTEMNFDYLGRLEEIKAGMVQHHTYQFNLLNGNLSERKDLVKGLLETFEYDNLERLEEARASHISTSLVTNLIETTYTENGNGNIASKTDAGIYAYDTQKKNAVVHVDNTLEQISFNTQEILYTPSAKSARITEGDKRMYFTYGAQDERIMTKLVELDNGNENILLKKYFVGLYEKEVEGITERHIHYIMAGDGLTAIAIQENEEPIETYFTYKDHLGSIVALTDENGDVFFEQSFDAWGRYRNPDDWTYDNITEPPTWLRGYTGHEHLAQFDLVNMNGRMYDPKLGRMLRPDNFVQDPMFTQSYNRYAYAFNNPLKFTDPDGEIVWAPIIIGAVLGGYTGYKIGVNNNASGSELLGYTFGGALIGGLSGGVSAGIAASGGILASTSAIIFGSAISSFGFYALSGGTTDPTISFGVGSYNFKSGEFGYLGKKGNSTMQNVGYFFGALANLSDIFMGFNPNNLDEVDLVTEHSDAVGHSAIVKKGTRTAPSNHGADPNGLVSVGPNKRHNKSWHWKKGVNTWHTYSDNVSKTWRRSINVNIKRVSNYGKHLNIREKTGKLIYSVEFSSCVSHTSRALNLSGVFNIGIHPFLLNVQMYLREIGLRPILFTHYTH